MYTLFICLQAMALTRIIPTNSTNQQFGDKRKVFFYATNQTLIVKMNQRKNGNLCQNNHFPKSRRVNCGEKKIDHTNNDKNDKIHYINCEDLFYTCLIL